MNTLLLFDLDGTLLHTGGTGSRAMSRAFAAVFGVSNAARGVDFAGHTDPVILRAMARNAGVPDDLALLLPRLVPHYLRFLEEETRLAPGRVLPGVAELLAACTADGHCLALGTGNLQEGAYIKLNPFGLERYFPVGGFGTDAEDRAQLIRAGVARAEAHYGRPFGRAVVIGDTPRDVSCGREIGLKTLAVATGSFNQIQLASCQPDGLVPDFADVAATLALLARL